MIDYLLGETIRPHVTVPEVWETDVDLADGSVAHIMEMSVVVAGKNGGVAFAWPGTLAGEVSDDGQTLSGENSAPVDNYLSAMIVGALLGISVNHLETDHGVDQQAA